MAISLRKGNTSSKKQLPSRFQQCTYIILFGTTVLLLAQGYSSTLTYHDFFQTKETQGERNIEITVPNSTYFCPIQDLKIGSWVNITYDLPPYTPMRGEVQQKTCSDFKQNSTFKTWIWEPEAIHSKGCSFKSFEEELYCRLMKNKTVAIIGAHYVPNNQLLGHLNNNLFPQLNDWQAMCELEHKDCLLIWRTTVPGHPNCAQFTRPSDSVEEMEHIIATEDSIPWTGFHWNETKIQNELVLKAFQIQKTAANLSYEVMDAYHVNILRPDMHASKNDCLHTCLPKDNTYSWLLNHMLHVKFT
ncbi:hypothetical protein FRACYDRAFT_246463 [Fragilariopsis cylindrus CCMP1102]|uniref:Uncharacterized protein n=1 Tax=Fragilariopsis cylindrus CCMP1102 TaxID=635003 RepID=A0A1E7EXS0_9STRA|nr:hypothetical protein FRACYDRAFT_246463 [Fragilariopsis cylindrus CCMP1102]|eukprot:OEU10712.1 hypothetical protein FRACYDRAFT_246463 [Fragilariopsis cylindrus CCMP1102]